MDRWSRKLQKKILRFCCALAAVLLLPATVYAAGQNDDAAEETSLTIHYAAGKNQFLFYKVAAFSETGVFSLEEPFDGYTEEIEELNHLDSLNTEGWNALATTLDGMVQDLQPVYQEETDENGTLVMSGIPKGLYLIIGETTQDDQYLYTPSPILVTVPNRDEAGNWVCHPVIEHTKIGKEDLHGDLSDYSVVKIWKDTGYEKKRPESIKVELLQDGKSYETVTLNQENSWNYTWEDLEAGHEWKVVEQTVPSGYTMTSTQEGKRFIITNTYKKPGTTVPTGGGSKLPQTGQLWWPVPILVILGILAILVGYVWRRNPNQQL